MLLKLNEKFLKRRENGQHRLKYCEQTITFYAKGEVIKRPWEGIEN